MSFKEALMSGLAPDGGLYMPSNIPVIGIDEIESYRSQDYSKTAASVLGHFLRDEIDAQILSSICKEACNFDIPLEKISGQEYIMRLDQGPTASFKDFAARIMARLMHHYLSAEKGRMTILTATSGDTGSAVASAFHGFSDIDVIILFPFKEVSEMQRKQMTTLKGNIHVVAVDGKFDDCQELVKKAFLDRSLAYLSLSSANSINIGRLLPQSVYYFHAWSRVSENVDDKAAFSVPCGNFGNLMGGLLAKKMGLPASRFIISTNSNDEVPEFLRTGIYRTISPSINCISSAMNVGHPSNFARIVTLYGGVMNEKGSILKYPDIEQMRKDLFGTSISDEVTRKTITDFYRRYGSVIEPHGAVAWKGIDEYRKAWPHEDAIYISLETAHPSKFDAEIRRLTGLSPRLPKNLEGIDEISEEYIKIENDYNKLKKIIIKH